MSPSLLILVSPSLLLGGVVVRPETTLDVRDGEPLRLKVTGLSKGETVIVHSFRVLPKWNGKANVDVTMHAWAEFRAGRDGIDVDRTKPQRGSYGEASGRALMWSSYPLDDPSIPAYARKIGIVPPPGKVSLILEREGQAIASGSFRLVYPVGMTFEKVDLPGLNGVFAYPKGARKLPVVIGLHGSEGGSTDGARGRAAMFASQGFATLAVNYFAYPYQGIPGVPTSHSEIPVETIARAREWLAQRPEADVERIGLYGASKGAEFAALAASSYDWIRAVVAVVPSDVVWEGYKGEGGESGTSSWSLGGKPFSYIPLYGVDPQRFRVNTDRYETSRRDHPTEAKAAEIPVERSKARFLLLGSDRDEVWASGAQVRRLAKRLRGRAESVVFPKAGHQLSGTGTFPTRLYGVPSADPRDKDLTAEGAAAERSWERTLVFLRKAL